MYEAALKRNPRDGVLASKIGQALVKTHNYNKAISYYDAALKSENQHVMRYTLVTVVLHYYILEQCSKYITYERVCGALVTVQFGCYRHTHG